MPNDSFSKLSFVSKSKVGGVEKKRLISCRNQIIKERLYRYTKDRVEVLKCRY